MLTSISVTVTPNTRTGMINISSVAAVSRVGDISRITISRKESGGTRFTVVKTIDVSALSDLTFELADISGISGKSYDYAVYVYGSDTIIPAEQDLFQNNKCVVDGLFIGDETAQYLAVANFKTEHIRNIEVEHVATLSGRLPYRISNADTNYESGKSSGLFMYIQGCTLVPDYYHTLSKEILDWLTDGNNKILKTHDGQAWVVSIDNKPAETYNEFLGAQTIEFDWVEIGELEDEELVEVSA